MPIYVSHIKCSTYSLFLEIIFLGDATIRLGTSGVDGLRKEPFSSSRRPRLVHQSPISSDSITDVARR
jgi:hypothetical protein